MNDVPNLFISYSWDNEKHKQWVMWFANKLRDSGVNANIDEFYTQKQTINLNRMMIDNFKNNDYILVIMTENYAYKADNNIGGVGLESTLLSNELQEKQNKIIPIKRDINDDKKVIPYCLRGLHYIDFSDDERFDEKFKDLLFRIFNIEKYKVNSIGEKPRLEPIEVKYRENNINKQAAIDQIYLQYVKEWSELADINNWNVWTSWMLGSGQPKIFKEMMNNLETLRQWLFSRIWPGKYLELENSFENFRIILEDLYNIFFEHVVEKDTMYITEKFYRIDKWDTKLYSKLLNEYNFHVSLVQDLILELTRAANYICDNVRKVLNATFRLNEGKLLVTYGPCSELDYKTVCPEYKDAEKVLKPYPGLEVFKSIRENRDIYFGYGKNSDEYLSLKNKK